MANHKGAKKAGGRARGVPNKATSLAREAIAKFVDDNSDRLTKWLDQIAEVNPKDAFQCYMSVVEYHIPKLARTEHTGGDGGAIQSEVTLKAADVEAIKHDVEQRYGCLQGPVDKD